MGLKLTREAIEQKNKVTQRLSASSESQRITQKISSAPPKKVTQRLAATPEKRLTQRVSPSATQRAAPKSQDRRLTAEPRERDGGPKTGLIVTFIIGALVLVGICIAAASRHQTPQPQYYAPVVTTTTEGPTPLRDYMRAHTNDLKELRARQERIRNYRGGNAP